MMKKLVMAGALVTLALGGAAAVASTFVAMTSEQMIVEADTVIEGRVIGTVSRWDDAGRIVISETRINVNEVIVGTAPSVVTVQTPGGEVGNTYVEAVGFPKFDRGQDVILFLKASEDNETRRVLGHQQGHFEVVTRVDGVTLAVPQIDEDVAFLTPSGQRAQAPQSSEVGAFKALVRSEAARLRHND